MKWNTLKSRGAILLFLDKFSNPVQLKVNLGLQNLSSDNEEKSNESFSISIMWCIFKLVVVLISDLFA